jgi:protein-S-isoprenylcysteine O-methyltransferase Ste14
VRPSSRPVDLRGELVFRLVFVAGIPLVPHAASVAPSPMLPRRTAVLVGVLLAWPGLLLRWWSFVALGRYFTLVLGTSPDQMVVTRGPYRILRHPGYSGLFLVVVGCAFMVGNAVGVVASTAVVLVALVHRIGIEERALTEALGESYREFARSRARLVPFVW